MKTAKLCSGKGRPELGSPLTTAGNAAWAAAMSLTLPAYNAQDDPN